MINLKDQARPGGDYKSIVQGASEPLTVFKPVLALTLLENASDGRLLTGVRTSVANATHQNVLSVPTIRMPAAIAQMWIPHIGSPAIPDDLGMNAALSGLASQKLGLGDLIELQMVKFEVRSLQVWQGVSVIDEDAKEGGIEKLTMFNLVALMTKGADLLPESTASYDPLRWVDQKIFRSVAATKDLRLLGGAYDPIKMCVHGLCVKTTLEHLSDVY